MKELEPLLKALRLERTAALLASFAFLILVSYNPRFNTVEDELIKLMTYVFAFILGGGVLTDISYFMAVRREAAVITDELIKELEVALKVDFPDILQEALAKFLAGENAK